VEAFGFDKLRQNTPVLLRIKGYDTKTFSCLLSSHLGKLGNKARSRNRLTGTGFTCEDAVHQLTIVNTELKGRFIARALRPTFAGKHLADINVTGLLRRNGELGNIANVCEDTTFTDSRKVRVSAELIRKKNGGIAIGFHTTGNAFLAVIRGERVEVVDQVILLFHRQIEHLQRTDSRLVIRPRRLCQRAGSSKAFLAVCCKINIRKECTVAAQSLHQSVVLELKQSQNILHFLIKPLIALCVANRRTDTHTGSSTSCHHAACTERLSGRLAYALCHTGSGSVTGCLPPRLTGRVGRILCVGIGLGVCRTLALVFSPVLRLVRAVRIHMGSSLSVCGTCSVGFGMRLTPVHALALSNALGYTLRIGLTPGFGCTLRDALGMCLTNSCTDGLSLRNRNTICLTNGVRDALVPTGALSLADALTIAFRRACCDALGNCLADTIGNTDRLRIAVANRLSNRLAYTCRFTPSFRTVCAGCLRVGVCIRAVNNENTTTDTFGLANSLGGTPAGASINRCTLVGALSYTYTAVLTCSLCFCHIDSLTNALG